MSDKKVLVVGGGIAGMSFAIRARALGWRVDLVEIDPQWRVYGAGISITGPTYRAFKRLGVMDEVVANGFVSHQGLRICTPTGQLIVEQVSEPIDASLPIHGGIMRPVLHRILSTQTTSSGTSVRLGVTVAGYSQSSDQVVVRFTDGTELDYELVVAADGTHSAMRDRVFPSSPKPRYTGQYCWRLVAERSPEIGQCHFYMAGTVTAGVMPTSQAQMYMFLLKAEPHKVRVEEATQWRRLKELMSPFGGLLGKLRDELSADSPINCRPLDAVLLPRPWHHGRIVFIGDAAHATTPHLASGAGISVEDALVLSEELSRGGPIESSLSRFESRRWERCRMVVENSVRIGEMEQTHADPSTLKALMAESELALRQDI